MNKIQTAIKNILSEIGEDLEREGIKYTPNRVDRLYNAIFYGYKKQLKVVTEKERNNLSNNNIIPITVFNTKNNDMLVREVNFHSFCEHHIVPFSGKAFIGIVPNKKLIGMNKLDRIVKYFGARLQIQERMTQDIADWIYKNIGVLGIIVVIKAKHYCAELQGDNGNFTTSAVRGCFTTNDKNCKEEFLELIKL